jgi:GH15 family glucan-1,4-alpha-glucosidase
MTFSFKYERSYSLRTYLAKMNSIKIRDYALIGNCISAALVSKYGSIDWCCLPEFDSPAIFSALLDKTKGGHFSIVPTSDFNSAQRYLPDTNVVETSFTTTTGTATIIDAFVAMTEVEKQLSLFPDHEILRIVQCTSGTVEMKMEFAPTVYYGKKSPSLINNRKQGVKFSWKENSFVLLTTLPEEQISISKNKATAHFKIEKGENVIYSFSCSRQSPAILPELNITAWDRVEQTIGYWKNWIDQCAYDGVYKEQVRRSALVLKLLTHAPSGAIVAAPTTSLPENLGGERNWDYRFCWLRDASFTVRALIQLNFKDEAHAYMNWILHATQLTRPKLQVLYSVYGKPKVKERTLNWLVGYENSKPVRIGNGAHNQLQFDVYGEVLDAFFSYSKLISGFDFSSRKFMMGLGDVICSHWNHPDNGIWEVRSALSHHTHSKVMAWVGLDRLIKLCNKYKWQNATIAKYQEVKMKLEKQIEEFGYNKNLNCYTRTLNDDSLDASSLVFSLVGYCSATAPRMLSTVEKIRKRLSKNDLIYRYHGNDGIKGDEGAFGICNFWLVENLAKAGNITDATRIFESIINAAGPTGLLSEEIDPGSFDLLGNYPQGFTHIGLINAALSIDRTLNSTETKNEHN